VSRQGRPTLTIDGRIDRWQDITRRVLCVLLLAALCWAAVTS
jgi:hypothetical protein